MRVYGFALVVFGAVAVEALPAQAQALNAPELKAGDAKAVEGALPQEKAIEVTPYVAFGSAAAAPVGVVVTFPVTTTLDVETDIAYRRGEGRIHALSSSASLLFQLPRIGEARPYLAAGIGLSQHGAPVFSSNGSPVGTQSRLAMTVNAGGGLKMPLNRKLDLRTDARWSKSFGKQGSEQFRVAQGISFDTGKR